MTDVTVDETPYTATLTNMEKLFGIPKNTLRRIAEKGHVRSVKVGEYQQSPRVYFVEDMKEYLQNNAEVKK